MKNFVEKTIKWISPNDMLPEKSNEKVFVAWNDGSITIEDTELIQNKFIENKIVYWALIQSPIENKIFINQFSGKITFKNLMTMEFDPNIYRIYTLIQRIHVANKLNEYAFDFKGGTAYRIYDYLVKIINDKGFYSRHSRKSDGQMVVYENEIQNVSILGQNGEMSITGTWIEDSIEYEMIIDVKKISSQAIDEDENV